MSGGLRGELMMPVNLTTTLNWETAGGDTRKMLEDLQGNILKGHGREHTAHLFLNFGNNPAKAKPVLRSVGRQVQSALDQLRDAKVFRTTKLSGCCFLSFYMTAAGYAALGIAATKQPSGAAFKAGHRARAADLNDPPPSSWDKHLKQDAPARIVHGMLLIADTTEAEVLAQADRWAALLALGGITVIGRDIGKAFKNKAGHGLEHFGYVDGRSQPLLLKQDVDAEAASAGVAKWDPAFPLKQVLVPDKGGASSVSSFGSYFVFRKLEQNVKGFKDREEALATALGLTGANRERAGAMAVGRFEDGTPFIMQQTDGLGPANDFNYNGDPNGAMCPFRSHIRKTNPRGESAVKLAQFGVTVASEREHIMARRGITYGERTQDADKEFLDPKPTKDVGLLFMAYMSSIENQFEFTQSTWANNISFVAPGSGLDPVIGQGKNAASETRWPDGFGNPNKASFDFHGFVTMKGGEYFFAPSKSFLTAL
jgi:Dyp-type peroxidase family